MSPHRYQLLRLDYKDMKIVKKSMKIEQDKAADPLHALRYEVLL